MTASPPAADLERDAFLGYLRAALIHLYDPGVLRASPLATVFGFAGRGDRATALQRLLTDAIEACRPTGAQTGAGVWRAYQVLRRRYIEQLPQSAVATDLGLSVRQLQREEKQARELLADQLWLRYDLDAARDRLAPPKPARKRRKATPAPYAKGAAGRAGELAWLRDSTPPEITDVVGVARRTLETAAPLLRSLGVRAELAPTGKIPPVSVQAVFLTQGVLSLVTAAARALPGGAVRVTPAYVRGELAFTVEGFAAAGQAGVPVPDGQQSEDLAIAHELAGLIGGALTIAPEGAPEGGPVSRFTLRVPVVEQTAVLIVDDNADAHELYRRFLADTRYRPIGLSDPAEAVAVAEQAHPGAVLLDVMMPGEDGWALLGRLREHPATCNIPVIICTVLPQADLALTLGAAEFLRKPVGRAALLAALERCVIRS